MNVAVGSVKDDVTERVRVRTSRALGSVLGLSRLGLGWYMFHTGWEKVVGRSVQIDAGHDRAVRPLVALARA